MVRSEQTELLAKTRVELARLRAAASEGQLKENHLLPEARKTIARILTLLRY